MHLIPDPRNIKTGWEIPTETYSDQPYIVQTDDGAWLCVMTTGSGHEGQPGQHIITLRSHDRGQSWSDPVDVEPADGPEASYAVLLKAPSGRVFCFYNHNSDNVREVKAAQAGDWAPGGWVTRVDTLGYHVFKYSDDHGQSWSAQRYPIPIRNFALDKANVYGGTMQFFWNVGKPFIYEGAAYISIHKVGDFGPGFMISSQGVLVKSDNLLTSTDLSQVNWETLPDGEVGLRTPSGGGPVSDEQNYAILSDGSFYCVYRSTDGHPVFSYSRDGGYTWSEPAYKRYADGRLIKHPRAANFAWKCQNGHYLYWFHNHGGRFIREHPNRPSIAYQDRNPVWIVGGVEIDSPKGRIIQWSQPEILLYDDDPWIRMSYPDLVEEDGRYFISETQKDVARVHEIDPSLLEGLWGQFDSVEKPITKGLVLDLSAADKTIPTEVPMPDLPIFTRRSNTRADHGSEDIRAGFSLDLWLQFTALAAGQVILDNRLENGQGICLQTTARKTVEIILNDGRTESRWDCDPGFLQTNKLHHLAVIVDGGPKIISFIIDGAFCDGQDFRQFGWGRFNPHYRGPQGGEHLHVAISLQGSLTALRIYNRALRTAEAIANFRAGS